MMKKLTILLLALCLCFVLFSCGGECEHADANTDGKCDKCESVIGDCTHDDTDNNGTCDKCGAEVSITVNCKHTYFKVVVTEATCTEGATFYNKCTKCGKSTDVENDGTPLNHVWERITDDDCLKNPASCFSTTDCYC